MESSLWDFRSPYDWMQRVRTSTLPPVIITCALTGGVQGKEANPNLPETIDEQVEQTEEAYRAGAAVVHIHAREPQKQFLTTADGKVYYEVNARIREKCPEIIINNSTGGGPGLSIEQRMACLDGNPEIASLNLGPFVLKVTLKERKAPLPDPRPEMTVDQCSPMGYGDVSMYARTMASKGIKPECEVYHPGMFWVMQDLLAQKLLTPPYLVQFVMGFQTGSFPTPLNVLAMLNDLPSQSLFSLIGTGPFQLPMNMMGIMLGGHVRVGMEDNTHYKKGQPLKSNAEAVERVVRMARDMNREIATPAQAREMMGLSATPNKY